MTLQKELKKSKENQTLDEYITKKGIFNGSQEKACKNPLIFQILCRTVFPKKNPFVSHDKRAAIKCLKK